MKDPRQAKTRLSPFLSADERERLARAMYADVLSTVRTCRHSPRIFVTGSNVEEIVSGDIKFLAETGPLGLNRALRRTIQISKDAGFARVLILHCDLPLITADDVDSVLCESKNVDVLLCPSKEGTGTNALALSPPDAIPLRYGRESFRRHLSAANNRGLKVKALLIENIARDIDCSSDLLFLTTATTGSKTRGALKEMRIDQQLAAIQMNSI